MCMSLLHDVTHSPIVSHAELSGPKHTSWSSFALHHQKVFLPTSSDTIYWAMGLSTHKTAVSLQQLKNTTEANCLTTTVSEVHSDNVGKCCIFMAFSIHEKTPSDPLCIHHYAPLKDIINV